MKTTNNIRKGAISLDCLRVGEAAQEPPFEGAKPTSTSPEGPRSLRSKWFKQDGVWTLLYDVNWTPTLLSSTLEVAHDHACGAGRDMRILFKEAPGNLEYLIVQGEDSVVGGWTPLVIVEGYNADA